MAGMPGHPLSVHRTVDPATEHLSEGTKSYGRTWYFSKAEIEDHSPSRKDGIDYMQESFIRDLYCSFLQDLATKLEVGSVTLATALMLCHRFFMRQSLAKNDWQVIATSCMFLACKIEEKLYALKNFVVVAYEIMYKWDPSASQRIKKRDVLSKQKELILDGERLILVTIAFDVNIEHPYKPLMTALKMLKLSENHVARTAWDFVNYGLRTTLCLQYKPHYLAAASLYLAAKSKNVRLPMDGENVWWLKFDVSPMRLQGAIKDMQGLLKQNKVQKSLRTGHSKGKTPNSESKSLAALSSQSCIASGSTVTHDYSADTCVEAGSLSNNRLSSAPCSDPDNHLMAGKQASIYPSSDCSSANSVIEDSESGSCTSARDSKPEARTGHAKLDVDRLKEAFKRTRSGRDTNKREERAAGDNGNGDARELEQGVDQQYVLKLKRQKAY